MYVPEINQVKEELDQLKRSGKIDDWELPYENLLTRRSAAIFFVTAEKEKITALNAALGKIESYSIRTNTEKKLSKLEYRVTFSDEEKEANTKNKVALN